jgi:DNA-binding response OmpR family regulator
MIKILWADDQVDVARSFASSLPELGATFEFVESGQAALEHISNSDYDLVLLDLAMPPGRWGGLWLLEQLRERSVAAKVIVVSGEGTQSETIQAIRLGAADYVKKEHLLEELPQQIACVLNASGFSIPELLEAGESDSLEYKSTLRMNLRSEKFDENMELAVLKTVAAFLNAQGGKLLVGVADDGSVVGIEKDRFKDVDKFQLHFWNLFRSTIGAEFSNLLKTEVCDTGAGTVFGVFCRPSNRPVFVKWKASGESAHNELFFVRNGPQTDSLNSRQVLSYTADRFK